MSGLQCGQHPEPVKWRHNRKWRHKGEKTSYLTTRSINNVDMDTIRLKKFPECTLPPEIGCHYVQWKSFQLHKIRGKENSAQLWPIFEDTTNHYLLKCRPWDWYLRPIPCATLFQLFFTSAILQVYVVTKNWRKACRIFLWSCWYPNRYISLENGEDFDDFITFFLIFSISAILQVYNISKNWRKLCRIFMRSFWYSTSYIL